MAILAGLAGSFALRQLPLLGDGDPLSATVAMLPLVLGLLAAARAAGGPVESRRAPLLGFRLAAASALIVFFFAIDQLGLRYAEVLGSAVTAGGLILLLFWQAVLGIRDLDRGSGRERREYLAFFLIVLAVYLGVLPWQNAQRPPDGDEPYYLLMAHSLAYDLDTDLANNYANADSLQFMTRPIDPQLGDPIGPNGEMYSRHNMALSLVLAPAYRVLGALGALSLMAVMTAALAVSILRLADLYFPERPSASLWVAAVAGLSSPLLLYSYQVWVEVPAALLAAAALHGILTLEAKPSSPSRLLAAAVPILLLPLLKLRFLALSLALLGIALWHGSRAVRTLLLRIGIALLALTVMALLFNQAVFGQALKHHSWLSLTTYFTSPTDYLKAPFGLFFDAAFGLFFTSPIWLLLIPGLWQTARRRPRLLVDTLILCTPYLLLLGPRWSWYGGWSPPFRYGIVFLPLLPLVAIPILAGRRRRGVRFVIGFLLAATVVLTMIWLIVPGWTYNFADGRSHLVDHLTTIFDADIARLFPSQVRPRAANLLWLGAVLVLVPAALGGLRRTASSSSALAGVATLLALLGIVPMVAAWLPTRTVEFEDPYVDKIGGEAWPERWSPIRPVLRGSWKLEPDDEVSLPLSSGDHELLVTLMARRLGSLKSKASLEFLADDRRLVLVDLPPYPDWSTLALDPVVWPRESRRLRIRFRGTPSDQVLLDRAALAWR